MHEYKSSVKEAFSLFDVFLKIKGKMSSWYQRGSYKIFLKRSQASEGTAWSRSVVTVVMETIRMTLLFDLY
jgi:hypothetical protein